MSIEIFFDLPFSLRVDGEYTLNTLEEVFYLKLTTVIRKDPNFPGAEHVENVAIVNDNTNILSHTSIEVSYTPKNIEAVFDKSNYFRTVAGIALHICNALVSGVRVAFNEHHLEYLYSPALLGPVKFRVKSMAGHKGYEGCYDGLRGGITFAQPPRTGPETTEFAKFLSEGAKLTPAKELLFEARRYLLRGHSRMALANLAISFETGLADKLLEIADNRNDQSLRDEITRASINKLGTQLAKKTFGHSFDTRTYWTAAFTETFDWIRTARNGVLHKAELQITRKGQTRDFNQTIELKRLFQEHDWLMGQIEQATDRVLIGKPPI